MREPEPSQVAPRFAIVEACDFETVPVGGQLTFTRQLLKEFGERIAAVGFTVDETPVGSWTTRRIGGIDVAFFSVGKRRVSGGRKPPIPLRLWFFLRLKWWRKRIVAKVPSDVLVQAPETLLAIGRWGWNSMCYVFHGVENPLTRSRYRWAGLISGVFERTFFRALPEADAVLACADETAIRRLSARSNGYVPVDRIAAFPTRVDTDLFAPEGKGQWRERLGIRSETTLVVTCGRISRAKGWRFLLDAFAVYRKEKEMARLVFVGDGEDRDALEAEIGRSGISESVTVTGFLGSVEVAGYLKAADLFVVGSEREGWSIAMLEALATGRPIVTTSVSGASELVTDGRNGFVVPDRDPEVFARMMHKALLLPDVEAFSRAEVAKYSVSRMVEDMGRHWAAVR